MPQFSYTYEEHENSDGLSPDLQKLIQEAETSCDCAYAPYSGFKVGCAVALSNGKIVHGANVENAAYPVGICAERTALAAAVTQHPHETISSIAISYKATDKTNGMPIYPCGMCRQFILEIQTKNQQAIQVILSGPNGKVIIIPNAAHLLPFGFSGADL